VNCRKPGGTPRKIGWGCAARFPKPLHYFRPKSAIFAISDLFSNQFPNAQTVSYFRAKSLKSIPYFRPKRLKDLNLLGCTYLYWPHKEFPRTPCHSKHVAHGSRLLLFSIKGHEETIASRSRFAQNRLRSFISYVRLITSNCDFVNNLFENTHYGRIMFCRG